MTLAAILLAAVGLSLGLIGGGGSVLAVPVLIYAAQLAPKEAISVSLLLVAATSAWAGLRYWKRGDVRPYLVFLFVISGAVGSYFGSQWTRQVSDVTLMTLFATLMVLIGFYMLKNISRCDTLVAGICKPNIAVSLLAGLIVGCLTGFLGVGGGFMIVPVLAFLLKCSMQKAIGTSLAIISINSIFSFLLHREHITIPTPDLLLLGGAMLGGAVASSFISKKMDSARLAGAFAVLIMVTGFFVLIRSWI